MYESYDTRFYFQRNRKALLDERINQPKIYQKGSKASTRSKKYKKDKQKKANTFL